jgi:hypothetical protein
MAAFTALQVSINNGSKAIEILSGENAEIVSKGDFIEISGSDLREVNRTYINESNNYVIELVKSWDLGNKSNQPAIVIPTTAEFTELLNALQGANTLINDNMQAMSDWQSKLGTVTFIGLDNVERTVKTLAQIIADLDNTTTEAVDLATNAAAETQTAIDTALGLASDILPHYTPALSVTFNDGLRIEHGYGMHDKLDISAAQDGSLLIDMPTKSVEFSRSSAAWNINKSGILEELALNEPAIGNNGVWVHESYTNYITNSTALYTKPGTRSSLTQKSGGILFGSNCAEFVEDLTSGEHFINLQNVPVSVGQEYNFSIYIKANANKGSRYFTLRTHSGNISQTQFTVDSDGVIDSSQGVVEYIGDGWYRCSVQLTSTVETPSTGMRLQITDTAGTLNYTGNGVSSFFISGAQVTQKDALLPLIVTGDTAETVAVTSHSIPIKGNLPAKGHSFTISINAEFREISSATIAQILSFGSDTVNGAILFRKVGDQLQFYFDKSDGTDQRLTDATPEYGVGRHFYTLTFDGTTDTFTLYCDGVLLFQKVYPDYCWFDPAKAISFDGRYNNQIKSLKILHYAASAEEVRSWGAPK